MTDEIELGADELPEDFFSTPTPFGRRQMKGRIRGRGRGTDWGVRPIHNNRAGHRLYIKLFQGRQWRINVAGFGSWRKPLDENRERHSAAQANLNPCPPREHRRWRRIDQIAEYRRQRKERLAVGWRKP